MKPLKKTQIKHHEIQRLVGATIKGISIEEIEDENGNTREVIQIDHTGGTHWIAPYCLGQKKINTRSTIEVMVDEQYAELTEGEFDE